MLPWRTKPTQSSSALASTQAKAKNTILAAVSEAVSEVQYQYMNSDTSIPSNDITTRLCTSLEAVFVHGLKETFLGRLSSRLSHHDSMVASPKMPEPSFWTFSLVFSHKAVISQVDSLTQVSSEVGRARAWLRMALNDSLLVSYLTAMVQDQISLSVHYEKFAFLRDPEKRDLCLSYLTGLSVYTFNLSVNVSTLNRWQPRPLVLAGCWRQTSTEVDMGADVAADMVEEQLPAPDFVRTLAQPIRDAGEPGAYMRRGLINEEEALRLILQSTPVSFSPDIKIEGKFMDEDIKENVIVGEKTEPEKEEEEEVPDVDIQSSCQFDQSRSPSPGIQGPYSPPVLSSSLLLPPPARSPLPLASSPSPEPILSRSLTVSPIMEWDHPATNIDLTLSPTSLAEELEKASLGELQLEVAAEVPLETSPCLSPLPTLPLTPSSPSLASCHSCQCSSAGPQPDCPVCSCQTQTRPQLVLSSPQPDHGSHHGTDLIADQATRQRRLGSGLGFSRPPSIRVASLSLAQNISLTAALDLVCQEAGLDSQDWQCQDCSKSIGAIFGPGLVCGYTKKYYCSDCHTNTQASVIPARLLYSWDGIQYKVARSSMVFLQAVSTKPFIDIRSFSPNLTRFAPSLETSYRLRKQLTYLSAYLTACSRAGQEGVKVALAEAVWPREYLYSGTDMYSIRDMEQLYTGELITTLTNAVRLCVKHVSSCLVCSGRGFICELCRDRKPVYPFNLDTTCQCVECLTVFHSTCAAGLATCPKCERLEARSLNWHVANSKLDRETQWE